MCVYSGAALQDHLQYAIFEVSDTVATVGIWDHNLDT